MNIYDDKRTYDAPPLLFIPPSMATQHHLSYAF